MRKSPIATSVLLAAVVVVPHGLHAQVDYHKAQQAGKVWSDRNAENVREARAKERGARVNSQGVAYDAPLTDADRALARSLNQADYDRLVRSVGKDNAERWLEFTARRVRSER
jgi:hypothetical protein